MALVIAASLMCAVWMAAVPIFALVIAASAIRAGDLPKPILAEVMAAVPIFALVIAASSMLAFLICARPIFALVMAASTMLAVSMAANRSWHL